MQNIKQPELRNIIQQYLGKDIVEFSLKGKGMCNNAWHIKTADGLEYLVKQERHDKETEEENDLLVEARLIQKINKNNPSLQVPKIVFICEEPKMYCYEYVTGALMKEVWSELSEQEKISLCSELGAFHAELNKALSMDEIKELGLAIDSSVAIAQEYENRINHYLEDAATPQKHKDFIAAAKKDFQKTINKTTFEFCHNDAHHENIIINNGKLACVIDFGDAGHGDLCFEFNYYAQDYPDYFEIILKHYEQLSNNKISRKRLLSQTVFHGIRSISDDNPETKRVVHANYKNWLEHFICKTQK